MANAEITAQRLQSLYEKIKRLRTNQSGFFKASKGSATRDAFLEESKKNEKDVDGFLLILEFEGTVKKV
jgi:hypothetical protein